MTEVTTPMHAPTTTTTTATADTAGPSVRPDPAERRPSPSSTAKLWIALAISSGLLATAIVGATIVKVPYYAFRPGHAFETEALIQVGGGAASYPSEGEILFLTVRVGPTTMAEAFAGWVDGDVDLFPEQGILQGRTAEENRAAQAAAMVNSKNTALVVAFRRLGLPLDPTGTGAVVLQLTQGSPAAEVLEVADVIVAVDGTPIALDEDLRDAIGSYLPGDTVTLSVEDLDGGVREESVTLAERPDDPEVGFLGVASDTRGFDPRPGFPVDIEQGSVGGPSAGLAFALAMIDVLSEGDLTGGHRVAVTGAIAADGTVINVGGVAQKTVVAARQGATVLLVPAGEVAEAQANPHGLQVIGVATIDDALAALEAVGGDPLPPPGESAAPAP